MTNRRRGFAVLLALLLCAVQTGCVPRQIRAAQDAFNQAARSENAIRVATLNGGSPALDATAAASSYRISLDLLDAELNAHRQDLAQEQMLGTALMLKAMCLWRLADLDDGPAAKTEDAELRQTLALVDEVAKRQPEQLGTRDRVMARALPGLRDHDAGLRAVSLAQAAASYRSAYAVMEQALQQENPPPNHPVRIYVRLAQLSTLRAYQSAVYRFLPLGSPELPANAKDIRACAEGVVLRLRPVLRDDPELKQVVNSMCGTLGIASVDGINESVERTCPYTQGVALGFRVGPLQGPLRTDDGIGGKAG